MQCGLEGKKIERDKKPGIDSCEILSLSQERTEIGSLALLSGSRVRVVLVDTIPVPYTVLTPDPPYVTYSSHRHHEKSVISRVSR